MKWLVHFSLIRKEKNSNIVFLSLCSEYRNSQMLLKTYISNIALVNTRQHPCARAYSLYIYASENSETEIISCVKIIKRLCNLDIWNQYHKYGHIIPSNVLYCYQGRIGLLPIGKIGFSRWTLFNGCPSVFKFTRIGFQYKYSFDTRTR